MACAFIVRFVGNRTSLLRGARV